VALEALVISLQAELVAHQLETIPQEQAEAVAVSSLLVVTLQATQAEQAETVEVAAEPLTTLVHLVLAVTA
jgi:hypothetical protein